MSSKEIVASGTESEDVETLLDRAHSLINEQFRPLLNISNRNAPCRTPTAKSASAPFLKNSNMQNKPQSVQDARKKLKKEWEKLKNSSNLSDDSLEKKLERDKQKLAKKQILAGVAAYIEIPNKKRTAALKALLLSMGATVYDSFVNQVTHIIFKNGSMETFKRAKLLNVHLVSVLWVEACKNLKTNMCEKLFPVYSESGYRHSPRVFRKFMEYQSKHFEYDENAQSIVSKPQTKTLSIVSNMENLNIDPKNRPIVERSNDVDTSSISENDSSSTSLRLRLSSDDSLKSNKAESPSKRLKPNNITVNETPESDVDTDYSATTKEVPVKRKLFAKRPLDTSFVNLNTDSSQSQISQGNEPVLPNPYNVQRENINKQNNKDIQQSKKKDCKTADDRSKMIPEKLPFLLKSPIKKTLRRTDNKAYLVSTVFHSQETKYLKELVARLGGFIFKMSVDEHTTHVIAGEPKRTINLLKGIARGCWILDKSWMIESAIAGHWLAEEQYELIEFSRVVQRSRFQRQTFGDDYSLDIFNDCGPIYIGESCDPPRKDLIELVRLCGGKITTKPDSAHFIIGENVADKMCVTEKWILDSITHGRYKTASKYCL